MFSFPCQKENTFLSLLIKHIWTPLCISVQKQLKSKKIWESHSSFQVFFPSNFSIIFLYYFLYVFIFFVFFRPARIIAKNPWSCLSVPKNTIYFLCLIYFLPVFLYLIYLLPVNFFSIPSFLLHLLVTVKNAHRKTQPISSQSSHKKHIFSYTFGSFLREIKIPKQDPTSPYPVSLSPDPAQREWRKPQTGGETVGWERDENWGWGADQW